jgi:hypothetical protein
MATDIVARAGTTRDDTCYDEYEGTNDASLDDAIRVFDDVIEPLLAGDMRAVDRALQIERSTLRPAADRFPNAAIDESGNLLRIDALLMRGAVADALMVLRHLAIGGEHEHAIAMRLAFAQIEAGQATQALDAPLARVIADEIRNTGSDQEWWGMVDQAERVWMRCRAERRALGDARALPMCEAAERLATEFHGNIHPNTARARVELAEALKGLRRTADARAMAQRAVDALATTHTRHPLRATASALAR